MITERQKMGLDVPGDQKVVIPARTWNAVKRALWRSRTGWEIVLREASDMVGRCRHVDGCLGKNDETETCAQDRYQGDESPLKLIAQGCPDREQRMSALVVLNAARMFAPADARKPAAEQYSAPSREYFSEIVAELLAAQAELEALHAISVAASPPPNDADVFLTQRAPPQFSAADFAEDPKSEEAP
jgi:hypothetical protein